MSCSKHFSLPNESRFVSQQNVHSNKSRRIIAPLPQLNDCFCACLSAEQCKPTCIRNQALGHPLSNQIRPITGRRLRDSSHFLCKRQKERLEHYCKLHERYSHAELHHLKSHKNADFLENLYQIRYNIEQKLIYDEFFISNNDQSFFDQSVMAHLMIELQQTQDLMPFFFPQSRIGTKYKDIKKIQSYLPKPKLFTSTFVDFERKKLLEHRKSAMRGKGGNQKKVPIEVGSPVVVFCPLCLNFHDGFLLAHHQDNYIVNFENQLEHFQSQKSVCNSALNRDDHIRFKQEPFRLDYRLGALRVPGNLVALGSKTQLIMKSNRPYKWKYSRNQHLKQLSLRPAIKSQIEVEALQMFQYLLNLKSSLLKCLKKYHDKLESVPFSENEKQQYGWVGSLIGLVQICLNFVLEQFDIFQDWGNGQWEKKPKKKKMYLTENQLPQLALNEPSTSVIQFENNEQHDLESNCQTNQKSKKKGGEQMTQLVVRLSMNILLTFTQPREHYKIKQDKNIADLKQTLKEDKYKKQVSQIEKKIMEVQVKLDKEEKM